MKNKYFIITIDTEADNQWDNNQKCTTENAKYLPRFQELAEKYEFKPVWLTTYEMANDDFYVKYMKEKQKKGLCEIGMHLHAWNNPPEYKLNKINNERDYLIEYPEDIIRKKIEAITNLLIEKFEIKPISHRSGRWTTNELYFSILEEFGYKIDCSVTPGVNWNKNLGSTGVVGSDYTKCSKNPYMIYKNILEVSVSIRNIHDFQYDKIKNFKGFLREIKYFLKGRNQWLRPDKALTKKGLIDLINLCYKDSDYIMFMIHSSELMPGGSPNFTDNESIDKLYEIIEYIFKYCYNLGYKGITLREFYNEKIN